MDWWIIEIKTLLFFRIGDRYSDFIVDMCLCVLKDPSYSSDQ